MKWKLVGGTGASEVIFDRSSGKDKYFVGRPGGKNSTNLIDLGTESACSRDTAIVNY
jgi:hypothetical protein